MVTNRVCGIPAVSVSQDIIKPTSQFPDPAKRSEKREAARAALEISSGVKSNFCAKRRYPGIRPNRGGPMPRTVPLGQAPCNPHALAHAFPTHKKRRAGWRRTKAQL